MKVHYINILLFSLPLNISEHNQRNHKSTTPHIPKIPTTRGLCECELYEPANYDHDPEMKKVMENFNRQTSQRFHEYDNRMVEKRKECKEQCDKEIQKIILKDKLEKELTEKFTTLETKITTDDIPTCVCKKSLADKTEKFCLKCGVNVGGGVTLSSGVLGGIGGLAINMWKPKALEVAIDKAITAGAAKISAAGIKAGNTRGMDVVTAGLRKMGIEEYCREIFNTFVATNRYTGVTELYDEIYAKHNLICNLGVTGKDNMCTQFDTELGAMVPGVNDNGPPPAQAIEQGLKEILGEATEAAAEAAEAAGVAEKATIKAAQEKAIEATSYNWYTTISYSIIAIEVIVLIMVIIYLILRYRRKKKMKKKLQYIKLLKE
ncbi:rifin [Plasmodium reichenowi]|uniref:Rifin n=1 Tax=Plasmodium reichenowi TaxID=5854 RepID=A0A060RMK4_PLARE|nr:rifin [Plasmodium reichenowi]